LLLVAALRLMLLPCCCCCCRAVAAATAAAPVSTQYSDWANGSGPRIAQINQHLIKYYANYTQKAGKQRNTHREKARERKSQQQQELAT